MCGAELLSSRQSNAYNRLSCSATADTRPAFHYAVIIESERVAREIFGYHNYIVQRVFAKDSEEVDFYNLYFPKWDEALHPVSIPAYQLKFDPHHPENVINKMKMMITFS